MKILHYCIAIVLSLNLTPHQYISTAQEPAIIAFGERPPIDIDRVPVESYESGKFLIKINPGFSEIIGPEILHAGPEGYVVSGIPLIDSANNEFSVRSFEPWFKSLYETNSKTSLLP
jgi:hypothetical protein